MSSGGFAARAQRLRALLQRLRLAQQLARFEQQQLAGIGELGIAPRAVEQLDIQVGLEQAYGGADGRLRAPQTARGLAERAAFGREYELA